MRRLLALLAVVAAVALGGGLAHVATGTAAAAPQGQRAKGRLHVVLTAQSHHPKLGHAWTYRVRVTDAKTGKPVACRIHLQFFFGGAPVGEVGVHRVANGVWTETIPAKGKDAFPPAAVGQPLVLHATVTAKGYRTGTAGWKVQVVR